MINPQGLGTGNYGKVYLASSHADSNHKCAIKLIDKKKGNSAEIEKIKLEVAILSQLDHPNISRYYETYESPKHIYLVMEYCGGVDLFERIVKNKDSFTEEKAAQIMKCLFLAINHCHSNNIAHRDLKPENIMYSEDIATDSGK